MSQGLLRVPWQIPLNAWVMKRFGSDPVVLPLFITFSAFTAALFEELGRWVGYRRFVKEHTFRAGVMYGLGHGGFESIALVGLSLAGTAVVYVLLTHGRLPLPPDKLAVVSAPLAALTPAKAFLGGLERAFALLAHVAMSLLVLEAVRTSERRYLVGAIALHFTLDAAGALTARYLGPFAAEGAIAAIALFCAWLLARLRRVIPLAPPGP